MKIIYKILLLLLLSNISVSASNFSPQSEISILTCSPGNELYSLFGHTAIRIKDEKQDLDVVFNYGTFDFNTPHFYLKYAQGLLPYQLSVTSYSRFLNSYIIENRSVYSQTLLLDSLSKQKFLSLLSENMKPENRTYLYNFLFDNCSTRVRDIIEKSCTSPVHWELTNEHKSFWNLLDEYLYKMPWIKWGIHTILGQSGSHTATPYQYMFLPDYLMKGLEKANYNNQALAEPAKIIYHTTNNLSTFWYFTPMFIFSFCTLLLIVILQKLKRTNILTFIAFPLFLSSGAIGVLLVFLSYFTAHPITAPNFNLMWANPFNLIAAFFLLKKSLPYFVRIYLSIYQAILIAGLILWYFLIPSVSLASLPLLLLLFYITLKLKQRIL